MRKTRLIAGGLLLLDGGLHIFKYFDTTGHKDGTGILFFGIIYLLVGILLFNRRGYPVYLGIIIPLIGMSISIILNGLPEAISMPALFKLIGLAVIGCCSYLIFNQKLMQ